MYKYLWLLCLITACTTVENTSNSIGPNLSSFKQPTDNIFSTPSPPYKNHTKIR